LYAIDITTPRINVMTLQLMVQGGRSFQQLDPETGPAGASRFFFRHDWIREVVIEAQGQGQASVAWSATGGSGQGDQSRFVLARPAQPSMVRVTCRAGSESREVEIWFVSCGLVANLSGPPGAGNPAWPILRTVMQRRYVGAQSYDFPTLGLITFPGSSSQNSGRRYGKFVELIGTVAPANVPIRFFQVRRVASASVTAFDAGNQPLSDQRGPRTSLPAPGANDTNRIQETTHTPAGKVFDYDAPGGLMTAANQVGDRHRWQVNFEQLVAVGAPPTGNQWEAVASGGRGVSAAVQWTVDYTARCTRAASATNVIPEVSITQGG